MGKKKILHIVESFGSGVFSFLVDLVNNTDEEYEIVIAYGKRIETLDNFKDYFNNRIKFIEIVNFTRNINLLKDLKAFFEIKRIIKSINPDIIHLHSSKAGFLGRFAVNGRKVKMLYNPHGFSFLMKNSSKIKRLIYWLLEKIGAQRKCTVVGCSYGEYEEALKLTKDAICINNGINIEIIDNKFKEFNKSKIDYNNLKVCTSGRIGFQKNPKWFNSIAKKNPHIEFTWIGDGELKNELNAPNISVTGWKSRDEVLELVNNNDIFILTSLWEGLPISLLEAMYLKKVCLVSNCIGNKDVIEHNKNGFIINEENFEEIIKNIDEKTYKKISQDAHRDVREKYSVKVMVDNYRKVYSNKC